MSRRLALYIAGVVALMLIANMSYAQGPPPPPGTESPIDGGVFLMVASAVAFGYRKLREKNDGQ